jgi:hypothetical protein
MIDCSEQSEKLISHRLEVHVDGVSRLAIKEARKQ